MRITLTLHDDLIDKVRKAADRLGDPFGEVINEALCAALRTLAILPDAKPHTTEPHKMELKKDRQEPRQHPGTLGADRRRRVPMIVVHADILLAEDELNPLNEAAMDWWAMPISSAPRASGGGIP